MKQGENSALSPLKRMDGEPIFDQPWQAQVLAMADTLIVRKVVVPSVWSETLGEELKQAETRGEPDNAATYYNAALKALERVVAKYGGISANAMSERRDAWEDAFLSTPHGRPVRLKDC